jgi:hypothetical protein
MSAARYTPMAPTLVRAPFHRAGWIYEEKVDGWRIIAYKDRDRVRLVSRNGVDHTRRFAAIAGAIAKLSPRTLVLDGEVAIYDQQLRSRFDWLREPDPAAVATPPLFMAFDLLYRDGRDLSARPLRERRARLEDVVAGSELIFPVRRLAPDGHEAWQQVVARGLRAPVLAVIDGNAGLRRAVGLVWPKPLVQRCCVHKLRNLERKAPKHALAEIRDGFHRIAYATNAEAARAAYVTFEHTWAKRCPGVVTSLREGGDELLTFFGFPTAQWKTLRTTDESVKRSRSISTSPGTLPCALFDLKSSERPGQRLRGFPVARGLRFLPRDATICTPGVRKTP